MKVNPLTEEQAELSKGGLLPRGRYRFKVKAAKEKLSSNGNPQIEIVITCGETRIYDYLVNTPKWQWKIRHFADSIGRIQDYEIGELNSAAYVGLTGEVDLDVEEATEKYKAKNIVADYVKKAEQEESDEVEQGEVFDDTKLPPGADFADDDIPF